MTEENPEFDQRTARNYSRLFGVHEQLKSETVSDFSTAYALLARESEADAKALERADKRRDFLFSLPYCWVSKVEHRQFCPAARVNTENDVFNEPQHLGMYGMNCMALLEHGFLGTEGDETRQRILKKYANFFALLKELNDVCHEYLRNLKLNLGNELEVFTVAYFIRGLITFQSLVVLLERGCLDDVRALCRTLLHAYFRLAALAADPTVLNRIRATSMSEQKKRLESFKSGKLKILPGSGKIDWDAQIGAAEAQFQKLGGSKINEKELATIGGRLGDYNTGYAVMSDAVHTSLSDLLSSLKFGHKGNFLGYIYGPNDKDLAVFAGYALALQSDNLINTNKVIKRGLPASFADLQKRHLRFTSDMPGIFNPQG